MTIQHANDVVRSHTRERGGQCHRVVDLCHVIFNKRKTSHSFSRHTHTHTHLIGRQATEVVVVIEGGMRLLLAAAVDDTWSHYDVDKRAVGRYCFFVLAIKRPAVASSSSSEVALARVRPTNDIPRQRLR
jgi:hypothetical protein